MLTPEERYQNDPAFHMLVDWLERAIHQAQYTPSELRDAALLAAVHYEYRQTRPRWEPREGGYAWSHTPNQPVVGKTEKLSPLDISRLKDYGNNTD